MHPNIEHITTDQLRERAEAYKHCKLSEFVGYNETGALDRVRTYGTPVAVISGKASLIVVYEPEAN